MTYSKAFCQLKPFIPWVFTSIALGYAAYLHYNLKKINGSKKKTQMNPDKLDGRHEVNIDTIDRNYQVLTDDNEKENCCNSDLKNNETEKGGCCCNGDTGLSTTNVEVPRCRRTAYSFFVSDCAKESQNSKANACQTSKFAKECAQKWKELSSDDKQYYRRLSKDDKDRYQMEFEKYKRRLSEQMIESPAGDQPDVSENMIESNLPNDLFTSSFGEDDLKQQAISEQAEVIEIIGQNTDKLICLAKLNLNESSVCNQSDLNENIEPNLNIEVLSSSRTEGYLKEPLEVREIIELNTSNGLLSSSFESNFIADQPELGERTNPASDFVTSTTIDADQPAEVTDYITDNTLSKSDLIESIVCDQPELIPKIEQNISNYCLPTPDISDLNSSIIDQPEPTPIIEHNSAIDELSTETAESDSMEFSFDEIAYVSENIVPNSTIDKVTPTVELGLIESKIDGVVLKDRPITSDQPQITKIIESNTDNNGWFSPITGVDDFVKSTASDQIEVSDNVAQVLASDLPSSINDFSEVSQDIYPVAEIVEYTPTVNSNLIQLANTDLSELNESMDHFHPTNDGFTSANTENNFFDSTVNSEVYETFAHNMVNKILTSDDVGSKLNETLVSDLPESVESSLTDCSLSSEIVENDISSEFKVTANANNDATEKQTDEQKEFDLCGHFDDNIVEDMAFDLFCTEEMPVVRAKYAPMNRRMSGEQMLDELTNRWETLPVSLKQQYKYQAVMASLEEESGDTSISISSSISPVMDNLDI